MDKIDAGSFFSLNKKSENREINILSYSYTLHCFSAVHLNTQYIFTMLSCSCALHFFNCTTDCSTAVHYTVLSHSFTLHCLTTVHFAVFLGEEYTVLNNTVCHSVSLLYNHGCKLHSKGVDTSKLSWILYNMLSSLYTTLFCPIT